MIRAFTENDLEAVKQIHRNSGLPKNCWPNLADPLFIVKLVAEEKGKAVQAAFVKLVGEGYVLVDHEHDSPQGRWEMLQELIVNGLHGAAHHGLDQVSCWVPPDLEASFGKRLENLSFIRSPWRSYTANLL